MASAQEPSAAKADVPAIEQIVEHYILEHPQVLIDSVRRYQEQQQAAQRLKSKESVAVNATALLQDADSPVVEPPSGSENAVTVVEFFDYLCGYCRKVEDTVEKLVAGAPGVRIVYKELPILGPGSMLSARAALAAAKQGQYRKFHESLMSGPHDVSPELIAKLAADLGLDQERLKKDMDSTEISGMLGRNQALAQAIGVESTPTFVIGRELVSGALTPDAFQSLIDKARSEMKSAPARTAGANK
jgi:protein-disulfide isomerase